MNIFLGKTYEVWITFFCVQEERAKQRKRDAKLERKRKQEESLAEYQDNDVAALMGFGGFGGSKKWTWLWKFLEYSL